MYLLMRRFIDAIPDDELSFYDVTAQFVNQIIKSVTVLQGINRYSLMSRVQTLEI
jgi:hypothetical protein